MKIIIIVFFGLIMTQTQSQNVKDVLTQISSNNAELKAASAEADFMKMEFKTGLTPSNPEIEYGYLWGNDAIGANKKNLSVSQTFDFPTVYIHKSKLSKIKSNQAELLLLNKKQDIMLEAMHTILELIYINNKLEVLSGRYTNAQQISQMTDRMFEHGEVGSLEKDKSSLQYINVLNAFEAATDEQKNLLLELKKLNGGKQISFEGLNYPEFMKSAEVEKLSSDFINNDPEVLLVKSTVDFSLREIKLAKSEWLPELSVAYESEILLDEELHGIRGGISIPLWQNKNKVKASKIAKNRADIEELSVSINKKSQWEQLKNSYDSRKERLDMMEEILLRVVPCNSLLLAYEQGEISLMDYIVESAYYFDSQDSFMEIQKQMYFGLADMMKVELLKY